ncbi:hypothetical protein HYH03_005617 [Edaphochlamys debaryana]|uniref:Uncharacterized protein n=1 Tax=Edaphochlamys debaryana TaxID=47281 RepID=A0A836C156_9CHLO|nr:hypothetical protein HYH03_005617 [Edaphochlamys debaryana]|eukprot:KAG2496390.1 hypothetical protein HYH03_005617 [Edaphochlamys debaryana]
MSKTKDAFKSSESWERWNTHQTTLVEQEVFGSVLRFVQDPASEHLGTTVWDASVVLAKWFEKNIRKGDFARAKVRHKKAIELGAGMGLAGMAFAMVGADVVLTDAAEVLGLLRVNAENNMSPAAIRLARGHQHGTWADSAGGVTVAELDWTKPEQCHAPPLSPPYDFVLAADCIYHETLTEHFHRTVMDVTNEKSTVVVCNELRSHSVQGRFMELFTATHTIKSVPHSKMDETYQHPNIFIYIMHKKKKKPAKGGDAEAEEEAGSAAAATGAAEEQGHEGAVGLEAEGVEAGAAEVPQAGTSGTGVVSEAAATGVEPGGAGAGQAEGALGEGAAAGGAAEGPGEAPGREGTDGR